MSLCVNCGDQRCKCPAVIGGKTVYPKFCDGWRGLEPKTTCAGSGLLDGMTSGTTAAPFAPLKGWECPRCRAINGPLVNQCTCRPGSSFVPYIPPTQPPLTPWDPVNPWGGAQYIFCAVNP